MTIEYVKIYLWIVSITWFVNIFGIFFDNYLGFKTFGILIKGLASIFFLAEMMMSLPVVHFLIFDYWR